MVLRNKVVVITGASDGIEKFTEPEDLAEVLVFMLSRPKKLWLYDVRLEY